IRCCAMLTLVTLLAVFVAGVFNIATSQPTAAATANTVNFQARLMNASGSIVPDGSYNLEFKLSNSATSTGTPNQGACTMTPGTTADPGCLWTETRTGGNAVTVANGYVTVNLGSVNALPSNIWNQ